ncbi:MAG: LCP family protein [Clostridiales bacterium]|nr:LCP family protein [Clostridiales bacterium]
MKKNTLVKQTVIISILVIFVLLAFAATYFYAAINSIYDDNIDIVTRTGDYSVPLTPEDSIIPIDSDSDSNSDNDSNSDSDSNNTDFPESSGEPVTTKPPPVEIPSPGRNDSIYKKDPIDPNIWNILLLGKDSYGSSAGRTDAIMILSYNRQTHSIKLISLMRDMLVPIEGYDWDRINTPYIHGGIGLCINTVNDVFDLDIQNYVMINFDGLEQFVDNIGGIEIDLTQDEVDYYNETFNLSLTVGVNTLNGKQALIHARNRSVGNYDFTRTQRQRDIIISLYNKILTENDLSKTIALINFAMGKVSTNIKATELISLASEIMSAGKQPIDTFSLPTPGTFQDAWYKNMRILSIDILANRKELRTMIYG